VSLRVIAAGLLTEPIEDFDLDPDKPVVILVGDMADVREAGALLYSDVRLVPLVEPGPPQLPLFASETTP
jgi:hypothetical protein